MLKITLITNLYIAITGIQHDIRIFTITHVNISLVTDVSTSSVKLSTTYPIVYHTDDVYTGVYSAFHLPMVF